MPRRARSILGGYAYHVLNRANGRLRLFRKSADFDAFEQVLQEAHQRVRLRILGYAIMSNHWHFVVWPGRGNHDQVTEFFRWLTHTHTQRWHAHHRTAGMGHVYQGRFKSFPIAADEHLLAVLRYVERNPLRAGLVDAAQKWRWSSLYHRTHHTELGDALLAESPVPLGKLWNNHVNQAQSEVELADIRHSLVRGRPYGRGDWQTKVAKQLGLEHSLRSRGRPRIHFPAADPKNESRPL